jgi:predicted MarR family transcription regulator
MARIPKRLASIELTTASVDMYTAPTNIRTQVAACSVANKTATARYVTVTVTPSGGSAVNLVYRVTIPANTSWSLFPVVGQALDTGDKISALAEANSALDFVMSGFESVV